MARKPREGSLLRIDLGDGAGAFARVLANMQVAVYSHRATNGSALELEAIYGSPILWKVTVMKSALTSGRWPVVDSRPLEPALAAPVMYFIKDSMTGNYSLYRSSDGHTKASTFEECKALEAAAVWDAEHVEERLRDHYSGD